MLRNAHWIRTDIRVAGFCQLKERSLRFQAEPDLDLMELDGLIHSELSEFLKIFRMKRDARPLNYGFFCVDSNPIKQPPE